MDKQEQDKGADTPASSDDKLLWRAFKNGDQQAYARIYQQHVRLMFKYGSKLTPDRDLVKDCIQELFLYLWERREHLGDTEHIRFYLFRSLRRSIISKLKKTDGDLLSSEISPDYNFISVASFESDLISNQSSEEYHQRLKDALSQLPDRQKEAIYLKYYHNLSFEEIASVMQVSKRPIYKFIYKALRTLQKSLLHILISLFLLLIFT